MPREARFIRSTDDLLIDFPTMEELSTNLERRRQHDELGGFNSCVNYLENLICHEMQRDHSDLTQATAESLIEYVSMQIGLDNGGQHCVPLSWLALVIFLRGYGAPYPRKLLASFEHFHLLWDVERFLEPTPKSSRDTRYPRYVSDYIRLLTDRGRDLLDETKLTDVY